MNLAVHIAGRRDGREERWRRGEVEEKEMVGKRWQGEWRRD